MGREYFIHKKFKLAYQFTGPVQYKWNRYYQISALTSQYFAFIDSLIKLDPDLEKIQLISVEGNILFDSDELIYGKYELIKDRISSDSIIVANLNTDHAVYFFRTMNIFTKDGFEKGKYLDVMIPVYDNLLGKLGIVRFLFSTRSLQRLTLISLFYQLFLVISFIVLVAFIYSYMNRSRHQFRKLINHFFRKLKMDHLINENVVYQNEKDALEILQQIFLTNLNTLSQIEERKNLYFEHIPVPLLLFQPNGSIIGYNQVFKNYFPSVSKTDSLFQLFKESEIDGYKEKFRSLPVNHPERIHVFLRKTRKKAPMYIKKIKSTEFHQIILGMIFDNSIFPFTHSILEIAPFQILEHIAKDSKMAFFLFNKEYKIVYSTGSLVSSLVSHGYNPVMDSIFSVFPDLKNSKSVLERMQQKEELKRIRLYIPAQLDGKEIKTTCFIHYMTAIGMPLFLMTIYPGDHPNKVHPSHSVDQTEKIMISIHQFYLLLSEIMGIVPVLMKKENNKSNPYLQGKKSELLKKLDAIFERVTELNKLSLPEIKQHLYQDRIDLENFIKTEITPLYNQAKIQVRNSGQILFRFHRKAFQFIMKELISNALHASNTEQPVIEITSQLIPDPTQPTGYSIQIKIKDYGTGIPIHLQDNIFEPFVSFHKKNIFSGLGLFLVKSFIQLYNGSIAFKSVEGKGSTFYVILPYLPAQEV